VLEYCSSSTDRIIKNIEARKGVNSSLDERVKGGKKDLTYLDVLEKSEFAAQI
jgi:hypothetical protein